MFRQKYNHIFFEKMASRRINTRSHQDLDRPQVVSETDKFLRKEKFGEGEASNSPLGRYYTLPQSIVIVEDIEFYLSFE